jgi:S-DNA-T family DNA segregation ATPase FtsK/SpoIIIE
MLVLATQRPDKDSLPTGVSANAGIRFCLRVMGQVENDMVLGTSAYKNGLRATEFTPKDRGIGVLLGHGDTHQVVRSFYLDGPAAEAIGKRARALREKAGTLTGHAAGEAPQVETGPGYSLLDDIAGVMAPTDDKIWSETVCERLAELRPDAYKGWDAAQLASALKPYGITTRQTWLTNAPAGKKSNQRGFTRDDLTTALNRARRDSTAGGEASA